MNGGEEEPEKDQDESWEESPARSWLPPPAFSRVPRNDSPKRERETIDFPVLFFSYTPLFFLLEGEARLGHVSISRPVVSFGLVLIILC